jgi:hypothetical protein
MFGWGRRLLVVAVLLGLVATPALAGAGTATAQGDSPTIRVTHVATGQPEPGVVRFETTYDIPETVTAFAVTPNESERATVTGGTGFEGESGVWTWRRDETDTTDPTVVWRARVNETDGVLGGLEAVGTGTWALFERPSLYFRYWYRDENPTVESTVTTGSRTAGYVSGETVYLGQYTATESQRGDQQYTLVVPASAESPPEPATVFATFGFANRVLDVGVTDQEVDVFVGPDPLRDGGLRYGRENPRATDTPERMWVNEIEPADGSTYYHEYAHTRQAYNQSDRMEWVTEAQAAYYDELLMLYSGSNTYAEFHEGVTRGEYADARLAAPNRTEARRSADYAKGPRVLAALDGEIRRGTDRNRSLEDVWLAMNRHQGRLTYDDFKTIVADVAGESFDDWLDRYLTTTAAPEVPLNRTLYAPVDSGIDSDGDGNDTQAELENGTNPFATAQEPTVGTDDDDDPTTLDTVIILCSLVTTFIGCVGLVVVSVGRGLARVVEWVPGAVSERSLLRLLLLTVGSVAVFVGYAALFM